MWPELSDRDPKLSRSGNSLGFGAFGVHGAEDTETAEGLLHGGRGGIQRETGPEYLEVIDVQGGPPSRLITTAFLKSAVKSTRFNKCLRVLRVEISAFSVSSSGPSQLNYAAPRR